MLLFSLLLDFRLFIVLFYFLQVKVYMGDGWSMDFKKTHFDPYSPPDFYTRVMIQ